MAPKMTTADSRERAERVFVHRTFGNLSWRAIMHAEGYGSIGAVQTAYKRHQERNPLPTPGDTMAEVIARNRSTTSGAHALMQQALAAGDADTYARLAAVVTRGDAELGKLYGLYAPERHAVAVAVTQTPAAILARTEAELLAAFESNQQKVIQA